MNELAKTSGRRVSWAVAALFLTLLASGFALLWGSTPAQAQTAVEAGFRDFSYAGTGSPTGEKPQSKLWFNDGSWWGVLWDPGSDDYHIYRFNWHNNSWSDTGTLVDVRHNAKADVLWEGNHLYVATAPESTSTSDQNAYVRRYSYNAATKGYSLDSGFPVKVASGRVEAIVLDRDSTGRLWVTYTQGGKVYVNASQGSDASWGTPFVPQVKGASNLTSDDISSVVAFDRKTAAPQIGVMWGNQNDDAMYWATHKDGDPVDVWQASRTAIMGPNYGDDHINLKSVQVDDSTGRVFAAVKTELTNANQPLILLLVLGQDGNWTNHVFGRVQDDHTRPIVLLDEENRVLHMFATAPISPGGTIYHKKTSLDNISFEEGKGAPFIKSSTDTTINNATSTKQSVNSETDLLVLASDDDTNYYLHNVMDIPAGAPSPDAPETTIDSGPTGTVGATSASFAFSSSEAGSTFECSLDGGPYAACAPPKEYTGLGEGTHTFSVRAIDIDGNVDASPASRSWTIKTTEDLSFGAEADATVKEKYPGTNDGLASALSVDGSPREQSYLRFAVSGVSGTVKSVKLRVYAFNSTVDGPAVYASGNSWSETGITWNNRPADTSAAVDDKGGISGNSWVEYDVTPLVKGDGTYSFNLANVSSDGVDFNSREATGNRPQLVVTFSNATAPETTIDSGPSGTVTTSSASFSFSSETTGSTFECKLDAADFTDCSSPQQYAGLTEGSHTFSVRATDAAGNADPTPASRTWTVDTTAPQVSSVAPPDGATNVTVTTGVEASFSEAMDASTLNASTFTLVERGGTSPLNAAVSYDPANKKATLDPDADLSAGVTYTAGVSTGAKDAVGNPLAADKAWSFTTAAPAETTPPSVTLTAPEDGAIVSGADVALSADATDNVGVDRVEFLANGSTVGTDATAPYGVSWDSTSFPGGDGRVTITARAYDSAANSATSADRQVIVNNTLPETTITAGPPAVGKVTTATFEFASSERDSTFRCRLDDEPAFGECASPKTYTGLTDGEHTLRVKAVGAAGEANDSDGTPASHTWTVDTTAPAPPDITSPMNDSLNNTGNVAVSGTAEAGSTVEIFDGASSKGTVPSSNVGDWSKTLTGVAEGSHTYTAKATDAAGNTSAGSNARTLIVDTTPPETTIDSGPSGTVNSTSATFGFSSESSSTFECKLDNGVFADCASPESYTDLAEGPHTFEVRATDAAGNTDLTPASRGWQVDTTAPTVGSVSPADGAANVAPTGTVEATFSEAMDASTLSASTFTLTKQGTTTPVAATVGYDPANRKATLDPDANLEASATYTATVKGGGGGAKDAAGNPLAADKTWSFTTTSADLTPPTVQAPAEHFPAKSTGGTSVPVELDWSATDGESAIVEYQLQESTNGGTFASVTLSSATSTSVTRYLIPDKTFQYRVRAKDEAGNVSDWAYGSKFVVSAFQETDSAIAYAGAWTQQSATSAYGGALKYAVDAGATATFTFTGREVAWLAAKAPDRGRAEVWLDGAKVADVDLYQSSLQWRRIVFAAGALEPSTTHTLTVKVSGTAGRPRVDADAFFTIR